MTHNTRRLARDKGTPASHPIPPRHAPQPPLPLLLQPDSYHPPDSYQPVDSYYLSSFRSYHYTVAPYPSWDYQHGWYWEPYSAPPYSAYPPLEPGYYDFTPSQTWQNNQSVVYIVLVAGTLVPILLIAVIVSAIRTHRRRLQQQIQRWQGEDDATHVQTTGVRGTRAAAKKQSMAEFVDQLPCVTITAHHVRMMEQASLALGPQTFPGVLPSRIQKGQDPVPSTRGPEVVELSILDGTIESGGQDEPDSGDRLHVQLCVQGDSQTNVKVLLGPEQQFKQLSVGQDGTSSPGDARVDAFGEKVWPSSNAEVAQGASESSHGFGGQGAEKIFVTLRAVDTTSWTDVLAAPAERKERADIGHVQLELRLECTGCSRVESHESLPSGAQEKIPGLGKDSYGVVEFSSRQKLVVESHGEQQSSGGRNTEQEAWHQCVSNPGLHSVFPFASGWTQEACGVESRQLPAWLDEVCTICLVEWELGDRVTTLACGHQLHRDCALRWAEAQTSDTKLCPTCKQPMFLGHSVPQ